MKGDILFANLKLNKIVQRKKRHKKAYFMDDALKTRGFIHLNVETWLLFAPPSKFLATRLHRPCTTGF